MLPPSMRGLARPLATILALVLALGSATLLGACGGEADPRDVEEGESAEIGELAYDVQLTRFLNPGDGEDAEYLVGQPAAPEGESYLGVFMRIQNESDDEDIRSASGYSISDIRGGDYEPVESESPFALDIGGTVPAGNQLPRTDTPAASGVAKGGILIFLVDDAVVDSRPLVLEIEAGEETAAVQLDM